MIKDIQYPEVKDVGIAILKEKMEEGDAWNVYLLNLKDERIENVLVSSKGYGTLNGEAVKTSTLRHFLNTVQAKTVVKVEPIMENVFSLSNEFWVSFYIHNIIYDKKFIFLPETINESYFSLIPIINKKGVMIL
jgi:hypothetical protein